jgi:hypothetical protein
MHEVANLPEIISFATIYKKCLVATAKHMSAESVPAIELLRITPQQPLHSPAQITSRCFHHEMKMVAHQAVGMNLPAGSPTRPSEEIEK